MRHQLHRGVEFVLKISDLVLFPFPFVADQRHGSHPGEPVQVLVLERHPRKGAVGEGARRRERIYWETCLCSGITESPRGLSCLYLQIHQESSSPRLVVFFLQPLGSSSEFFLFESSFPSLLALNSP